MMKLACTFLALIGAIAICPNLHAESLYEGELKQLTEQHERELSAAVDPINHRYSDALEKLLRRATQNNDLEAGLKIKNALAALNGGPAAGSSSELSGKWAWTSGRVLSIHEDGSFVVDSGEGKGRGGTWRWEKRPKGEFTMIWATGNFKDTMTLSSDGNHITGANNKGNTVSVDRIKD